MNFFSKSSATRSKFEQIGLPYDEPLPRRSCSVVIDLDNVNLSMETAPRPEQRRENTQQEHRAESQPQHAVFTVDPSSDATVSADFRSDSHSSSVESCGSNIVIRHRRYDSNNFRFSGHPVDVLRFRSCISPSRHHSPVKDAPEATPPFPADIFNILLLFIDATHIRNIIAVSSTCRFWRYHSNYAPHWTYFRSKIWLQRRVQLPQYIQELVTKPKILTRDEYIAEIQQVEACKSHDKFVSTANHLRWCVAIALLTCAMIVANFGIAFILSYSSNVLNSDKLLGTAVILIMALMTLVEVLLIIVPLGRVSDPNKDSMMRILAWVVLLLGVSLIFGTVSSLAFTRVNALERVLQAPTIDLTKNPKYVVYSSEQFPSFALLPAQLSDLRWRMITMDPEEKSLIPYRLAVSKKRRANVISYILLFFDQFYESSVYKNNVSLAAKKNIGTRTALGFDPTTFNPESVRSGSESFVQPHLIALTAPMYDAVRAERDVRFPSSEQWLNPNMRLNDTYSISYRCSSAIQREETEYPPDSTKTWISHSVPWTQYRIPLVTNQLQERSDFQMLRIRFLRLCAICYIITTILCVFLLVSQCIFKNAAVSVLGATTTIAFIIINPVVMILAGILCVHFNKWYLMCSVSSGGYLIGGGIAIAFLLTAIYVSVLD